MKTRIINCHVHLNNSPNELDEKLDIWREKGVVHSCLSAVGPYYGKASNDDVKKVFLQYPKEITGFGFVRLGIDKPNIIDWLKEEGFGGIKVICPISDYSDKKYFKIYEKIEKYQMPVLFHTGYVAQTHTMKDIHIDRMRPVHLDTIARRFPELKLIGAHLGNPWFEEAIQVAKSNRNIYFDLSGGTVKTFHKAFFQRLLFRVKCGEINSMPFIDDSIISKFVYGSDGDIEGTLKLYLNLFEIFDIKGNIQQKILFRNMEEILQLQIN